MPERTPSRLSSPGYRQIDATADFSKDLDDTLSQLFPLITDNSQNLVDQIKSKQLHAWSFQPNQISRERRDELLLLALEHSSTPDNPVFSVHGDLHQTFQESVDRLARAIQEGNAEIKFEPMIGKAKTHLGEEVFSYERLVIESPKYNRASYRPFPHQFASELEIDFSNKAATKNTLKEMVAQYGIPFSLMVMIYLGLNIKEIFDFFGNKDYRATLKAKLGNNTKIPSDKKVGGEDVRMLTALTLAITVKSATGYAPSPRPNHYIEGLEILANFGYLPKDANRTLYQFAFSQTQDVAFARGVFLGMREKAQRLADPSFFNPVRATHIERYTYITTSKLITAFLVIEPGQAS